MIELQNVDVIFNEGTEIENHVLKGINLKVCDGQFVTIIGGNGAGKSTLMNVLSGNIFPNKGKILIDGLDVTKIPVEARASMVSRVFQEPTIGTFADLTIEENMVLALKRGLNRGFLSSLNENSRDKFKLVLATVGIGLENRLKDKDAHRHQPHPSRAVADMRCRGDHHAGEAAGLRHARPDHARPAAEANLRDPAVRTGAGGGSGRRRPRGAPSG